MRLESLVQPNPNGVGVLLFSDRNYADLFSDLPTCAGSDTQISNRSHLTIEGQIVPTQLVKLLSTTEGTVRHLIFLHHLSSFFQITLFWFGKWTKIRTPITVNHRGHCQVIVTLSRMLSSLQMDSLLCLDHGIRHCVCGIWTGRDLNPDSFKPIENKSFSSRTNHTVVWICNDLNSSFPSTFTRGFVCDPTLKFRKGFSLLANWNVDTH